MEEVRAVPALTSSRIGFVDTFDLYIIERKQNTLFFLLLEVDRTP
jgi:hypothetical protein